MITAMMMMIYQKMMKVAQQVTGKMVELVDDDGSKNF
jgi:hypothetical protein